MGRFPFSVSRCQLGKSPPFLLGLDEALEVRAAARNASSVINASSARVQRVDEGVERLQEIVFGAAENIAIANAALNQAESQCK